MNSADAERLAGLWTAAQPIVYSFVCTMVGDRSHVDDLVQRTAVACVRKFDSYDEARAFHSWAIGVARLEVLAWRRVQAKESLMFDDLLVDQIAAGYERLSEESSSVSDALAACLKETSERGRLALELFHGQGQKTDVVARKMNATSGTIRNLLSRTRHALRECIQRRLAVEEDR